ncbi:MAG: peptide chain release factor N(5)-glutamine methyltransferase [Acetobacteraceae bacterium]
MSTIAAALAEATAALARAGIEAPRREARLLLEAALGRPRGALLAGAMGGAAAERFAAWVARREAREPLALILGRREFWSLEFAVSPATLIPRPESETLIEAALAAFPERAAVARVLDLGTGTGCLLLAALSEFPAAFGVGVDLAPAAAALAARNARGLGLAGRAGFLAGNWAQALGGRFDLVLANPPYVATGEIAGLMAEVARHEPRTALDGGADGLGAYRALVPALPALLAPGGRAIVELGAGQAGAVAGLAAAAGLAAEARADLAGVPRALVMALPQKYRLA